MNCSVQEKLEKLCELMNKASKINIKVDQGLTNMMASLKCKQALLTDIVASYQYLINEINVCGVIGKLKKRCQQVSTSQSTSKKILKEAMTASTIEIECLNSKIAWKEAFRRYDNSEVKNMKDFSSSRVHSLALEVESNFCVNILNNSTTNDIDAVLGNFPVIFFSNKTRSVLVDLHELLFEKDCLFSLLAANKESVKNEVAKPKIVKPTATVYGPKNKVGCKPLWQKFP